MNYKNSRDSFLQFLKQILYEIDKFWAINKMWANNILYKIMGNI